MEEGLEADLVCDRVQRLHADGHRLGKARVHGRSVDRKMERQVYSLRRRQRHDERIPVYRDRTTILAQNIPRQCGAPLHAQCGSLVPTLALLEWNEPNALRYILIRLA